MHRIPHGQLLTCRKYAGDTEMEYISFDEFNNEIAWQFIREVVKEVKEKNLKPLRIRVRYEGDIVAQYLMPGKKSEEWLDRKEKTVMKTGESSLEVWRNPLKYPSVKEEDGYAVCGGGYPLYVNNELKGAFVVSGLEHTEDHALIVKILKKIKGDQKNDR